MWLPHGARSACEIIPRNVCARGRGTLFVGLDCETTGSDCTRHELIQIGLCLPDHQVFSARVGWRSCMQDAAALKAIGIDPKTIGDHPSSFVVDRMLCGWLVARGVAERSLV